MPSFRLSVLALLAAGCGAGVDAGVDPASISATPTNASAARSATGADGLVASVRADAAALPDAADDAKDEANGAPAEVDGAKVGAAATASGRSVDRRKFFDGVRANFGPMNQGQVDGINHLLTSMEADQESMTSSQAVWRRQMAYLFATVKHEVANTYQPITEYSDTYCVNYDGGCRYKGRGYVQLTHRYNYQKMSPVVGVDLVSSPWRALEPAIAYRVMSYGMFHGSFTGRKLGTYISSDRMQFINARRVVNGLDRAELIAGYARRFNSALYGAVR